MGDHAVEVKQRFDPFTNFPGMGFVKEGRKKTPEHAAEYGSSTSPSANAEFWPFP